PIKCNSSSTIPRRSSINLTNPKTETLNPKLSSATRNPKLSVDNFHSRQLSYFKTSAHAARRLQSESSVVHPMATSDLASHAKRQATIWVVLACFFASGTSGLVYQVVWVRELVLVFGATTFAVSTVLTAFMGGLAVGSYYFGRRSSSVTRPLRLYGLVEIGIGLYGLAVPFIFGALPPVYHLFWRWLHLSFFALSFVRFVFASAVLVIPTALMGATLPVLSSYYARDLKRIGLRVGQLYAVNTFGAVIGAAATGFALIPTLGMSATTATAAAINLALGVVALAIDRREHAGAASTVSPERPRPRERVKTTTEPSTR